MKTTTILFCLFWASVMYAQSFLGGNWGENQIIDNQAYGVWSLGELNSYPIADEVTFCAMVTDDLVEGGEIHLFGIVPDVDPNNLSIPTTAVEFNIAGQNGDGEIITLNFSGITDLDFIGYCGTDLHSYSYDGSNLTIAYSPTVAAQSASNDVDSLVLFGMVMVCGANTGYDASVFRTDMYWEDISLQKTGGGYGEYDILPGANFDGTDGENINFDYYVKQSVLENLSFKPVTELDKCGFVFKKATGAEIVPEKTVTYFTLDGQKTAWGEDTQPQQSTFDFDGNGIDNYVQVHVNNSSWSDANGCVCGESVPNFVDAAKVGRLNVYCTEDLRICVENKNEEVGDVSVYSLSGALLKTKVVNSEFTELYMKEQGMYLVKVRAGSESYLTKVIL